ncbi:unnamed protein product [Sphagnum jensenii]|uniref:Uncharacterized protein n=1 Tax=Sphagnum jensenii TaxID=128206 RepID=A0ABP1BZD7_9BRYO
MAQVWKVIADTLQSTAHLLPPPADSAVGLVGTVARLTQKALEGKEASKENQRYIEQLVNRAVEIASIIKKYVAESRYRDEVFLRFVTSFHTTMEEVSSFVANFAHERWLQRLIYGSALKSQFKDLWRQLDAIAVDFTLHFLRIMDSKGPHERIEHPKLRDFWKHSMTNVHEAKWIHFWDQFLFEFPSAQPFLTGASASANNVKFQEKALPKDANFVGPLEINNLFQPPTALVEEILSSVLAGDEQAVILKYQASATEKPREVHCWNGYWIDGSQRGDMTAELFIADGHKIYGGGSDEVGDFTWTGECHGSQVHMIKQYIGQHQVLYNGKIKGATMDGTWLIHDGWWHSKGAFHLERQCPKPVVTKGTRPEVGMVQIGGMQEWAGYYEQWGEKNNMSANIIFTNNKKIYGNGMDSIGRFTWLGRYYQGSTSIQVDLVKQYEGKHPVCYLGEVAQEEHYTVAMKGNWMISNGGGQGKFFLQLQVSN